MLAREKIGVSKILILKKADIKLSMIRLFIRMSYDVKSLPEKRYIESVEKTVELGKMLGGWIKSIKTKEPHEEAPLHTSEEPNA